MARTDSEILASLKESLSAADPSIDTEKGPVFNFLLRPVPSELQKTEADAERVAILATLQLDQVTTDEEVAALATSFSIRLGGGKASKTKSQLFFALRRPLEDIVIDRGNLVGTDDQQFTYFVSEARTMPVNSIDNFFNPQTRRYEILVPCEATAVGPTFDLPPSRVTRIITPIDGIDGTINTDYYRGGEEAEDLSNSIDRVRAKLAGLDPETGGGIISDIRNFDSENVRDVSLVYPKDRSLFKRVTSRPAIDAYVLGSSVDTIEQTVIATGGETQIQIERRPVTEVSSVTVNGTNTAFTFIPDTSREFGGSPRSSDYILLEDPLVALDTVVISYEYNQLLFDLQNDLFSLDRPFDTDVLARKPRDIGLEIALDAVIAASFDTARAFNAIEASLFSQVESDFFVDAILPEVVRQNVIDEVGGITQLRFTLFRRTSGGTLDVEPIDLDKNETAFIDQTLLSINVRR